MMQKRYSIIVAILLMHVSSDYHGMGTVSSLASVQQKYQTALQDLISVNQKLNMPIQLTDSTLIGSTYLKIIKPYVKEIQGYAGVVMSAYVRKFPYYDDLKVLSEKLKTYESEVKGLIKVFPESLQQEALLLFYNQLTNSVVQNCAKIVQDISYALSLKPEDLEAAKLAYKLAWKVQTPTMVIPGFATVATFQTNMTTWMINLYQAAIAQATNELQTTSDRAKIYAAIASYYKITAQVFTNSGNGQKASNEKLKGAAIAQQETQSNQAQTYIDQAVAKATLGRGSITIDFATPSDTKNNLSVSLQALQAAQGLYGQASTIYTAQQDEALVNLCQAKISELNGDIQIRGMQILWVLFLQNAYRTGVTVASPSFTTLQNFYKLDPIKQAVSVDTVVGALSDLLQLCTAIPNNFNTQLAIVPLLKQAMTFYQSATAGHVQAQSSDRLASMALLNDLQDALNGFVIMLQDMIAMSSGGVGSVQIAQLIVQAKKIDVLFAQNSLLKDLFFYIPKLEVDTVGKQSFASFAVQYLYRILMSTVMSYQQGQQDDQAMAIALSDLTILQDYKDFMTAAQVTSLQQSIVSFAQKINVEKEAQSTYTQAQAATDWTNSATPGQGYQSTADSLWIKAIQFYEIALQLSLSSSAATVGVSSTATLEQSYVQVLQEYVTQFAQQTSFTSEGYQLHMLVPLYKLQLVGVKLQDKTIQAFVVKMLAQLFGGTNGFFAQVDAVAAQLQAAAVGTQTKTAIEKNISQLIAMINVVIEQQTLATGVMTQLLQLSQEPDPLLVSVTDDATITLTMKLGTDSYTAQLTNPIAAKIAKLTSAIAQAMSAAQQAETTQNFASAQASYSNVYELCYQMLQIVTDPADFQKYKDQYFLAKTRFEAASLAAAVTMQGAVTLGGIKNIPQNYYATNYQSGPISMQLLGGSIPASLQKFTQMAVAKDAKAQADALVVFKAYLLYQLLQQQGLNFTDCFVDYRLQPQQGIAVNNQAIITQAQDIVNQYIAQFTNVTFNVLVSGQTISFVIQQMPISPVVPLYATGPYAAVYFVGASGLFQPGNKLITVGGAQYVPGQDQTAYQLMLNNVAYAYLSQALQLLASGQKLVQSLVGYVTKQAKANQALDTAAFMTKYNQVKEAFVRGQSLLFASGGSAYYYFEQAGQATQAAAVKKLFLDSYQTQIEIYQQLLVGNPTSNQYNMILSDMNQIYITWSAELDPVKDAAAIAQNNQAIAVMFKQAGDACMKATVTQPMFPSIQQYCYKQAAGNYQAAYLQYQSMNSNQQMAAMNTLVLQAYFLASNQKIQVYNAAQQKGLVYTPAIIEGGDGSTPTTPQQVSFAQLFQDYQTFQAGGNIDAGEIAAYNTVKNLLLDAAMYYQYLSGTYAKQIPSPTNQQPAAVGAKTQKKSGLNPQLVTYLQGQNIIPAKSTKIPFAQQGILPKIFNMAATVYNQFSTNPAVLADWCNSLNMAVAYQYINDYEGGLNSNESVTQQASDFQTKWQSFFTALQKESSAMENPASAYVG